MKLILGDNQFFGINHVNLQKAKKTRELFNSSSKILDFIIKSKDIGMDGFMINSNDLGFKVVEELNFINDNVECHYSIPYPHKYAGIVNDAGVMALVSLVLRKLKLKDSITILKFLFSFDAVHLLPIIIRMEIPKSLPKGSIVYLQNVVTDLTLGLKNGGKILKSYLESITSIGYKPGIITLNPTILNKLLSNSFGEKELYVCFNINYSGFNVFPCKEKVEQFIVEAKNTTNWKLMGMSIFSSGASGISIRESIDYIKTLELDYVVFGSSRLENIAKNIAHFNH